MIAEMLEWCFTPCPWFARRSGLLAAQIAIRHRARRCHSAWRPHFDACRKFSATVLNAEAAQGHLVVLGSGHLYDLDLPFLQSRFDRITLVDAVHPLEIQFQTRRSMGRLAAITTDLSKPSDSIAALVSNSDWTLSCCLLSQLSLFSAHQNPARVVVQHLELIRSASRSLLITDVAKRPIHGREWTSLLEDGPLPAPEAEWIWTIAPPGESCPAGEERLVQASTL